MFLNLCGTMTQEKKTFQLMGSKEILLVYTLLLSRGIVSFPVTPETGNKIDAIVHNVCDSHFNTEIYRSIEEKAVAYLYFLIKNHPFVDGNKRTAVLVFEVFCELNDIKPQYEGFTLDELAVYMEQQSTKDHQKLIKIIAMWLFTKKGVISTAHFQNEPLKVL